MKTTLRLNLIFSALLCFAFATLVSAQQTAEDWMKQAEKAVAEGRTEDAANAYSGAAHEQMKNGEYEKAGDNYKKAAEKYRDADNSKQAFLEAKNAGFAYEEAARTAAADGDHDRAAELYDKGAEQYDAAGLTNDGVRMRGNADYERKLSEYTSAGNPQVTTKPTGTGRTIGNIANISVTNNNPFPISTVAQDVYITATSGKQDYVGHIPAGIVIPPYTTVSVPVDGICTNPFTPPVSLNEPMSDLNEWVPVGKPQVPEPMNPPSSGPPPQAPEPMNPPGQTSHPGTVPVILVTSPPVETFDPSDIPNIIGSKGYTPSTTPFDIVPTWPGTDIPVGGTFSPELDPRTYARVIVEGVRKIKIAARVVQESGQYPTPFTPDPPREYEALCQHSVWIFAAAVTGGTYDKEAFTKNVYNQMQTTTGVAATSLPPEQKEELQAGVSSFWLGYMATGAEAKVLADMPVDDDDGDVVLIGSTKDNCVCGDIKVPITMQIQRMAGRDWKDEGAAISRTLEKNTEEQVSGQAMADNGYQVVLTLGAMTATCYCITAAHTKAVEDLEDMKKTTSKESKAITAAKAIEDEIKKQLADLEALEKEVAEKRSINAESKLNILWKAHMPKAQMNEFDKDNKNGKRADQIDQLKKVIQQKIADAAAAVAAAERPVKEKEAEVNKLNDGKKQCDVFNDSKKKVNGAKITVSSGSGTISEKDGKYTFGTNSLKFMIKVEYFCVGDPCNDVRCSRSYTVTFSR